MRSISIQVILSLAILSTSAQKLRPGFDKEEYRSLMLVSAQFGDSSYAISLPPTPGYRLIYGSPVMGLENKWELWLSDEMVPIISIRGTTTGEVSWLANFYAAMVPAKGQLQLSKKKTFRYELASDPNAAVHVGWLISTAFLVEDMIPKIDSLQKSGHKEMLIMGHSQGGAIAYLLTSYLRNLQKQNLLSPSVRFKTYCSAGPKPGNLYFAYEYENITQGGWGYNVVNSADWVPEIPVTVQTLENLNTVNPFVNAKDIIGDQGFFKRLALNYAYGKLRNPNQKAADNYRQYLGNYMARTLKKHLPEFVEPTYAGTIDYVRTSNTITLLADAEYFQKYPEDIKKIWTHHFHQPYLHLLEKLKLE